MASVVLTAYALIACTVTETDAPDKGAQHPGLGALGEVSPQMFDPWAGPIESLRRVDLADSKLSVSRDLQIPKGALGFTTFAHVDDPKQVLGVESLRAPNDGGVAIDGYANAGHKTQIFVGLGWIAAAAPQSDTSAALPVSGGVWKLQLGDDGKTEGPAHVSVWVRRTSDGNFHGGVVDVNVFLAPGGVGQSYVQQVLDKMFPAFAGLELGDVAFYSLPKKFTYIDDETAYRELIASSAGIGTSPALNLFVIGSFGSTFNGAIGMAAGIPGNTVESGTPLSGLAYAPQHDASYDATVLLHEMGHLGGLFHTTEFQLTETDPLSDTPECDHSVIKADPESCPDLTNTMFPIAYGATSFTPHQLDVLHGSALYRGALSEGSAPSAPLPSAAIALGAPSAEARGIAPLEPQASNTRSAPRRSPAVFGDAPDQLERILGGVWCQTGGTDYEALAISLAGADAAAHLRDLALQHARADVVRARAFGAFVRAVQDTPELEGAMSLAAGLLHDDTEVSPVRIAALQALAKHEATRARSDARALVTHDVAVGAAARAVLGDPDR